jgi:hypothetical protein
MSIVLLGSTSGSCTLQEQAVAGTTTLTLPTFNGTVGLLVSGTVTNTTSGTTIPVTGIPAGVRRVTVMFQGVTISGSTLLLQIGSTTYETSGYVGTAFGVGNTGNTVTALSNTGAFQLSSVATAGVFNGTVVLTLLNSSTNLWSSSGNLSQTAGGTGGFGNAGSKTISGGALGQLRLNTNSGTDTFSSGSINILYE